MVMRLLELRNQMDMKQVEFAALLGVSQGTVSDWEREIYLPKARDLPRLAQVLGCTINDLFQPLTEEAS